MDTRTLQSLGVRELEHDEQRDHDGGVAPTYEIDPITGEIRIRTCTETTFPFPIRF